MSEIHTVESLGEIEEWIDRSRAAPVWLFKHSLTCGVSSRALKEFRRFAASCPGESFAMVAVQTARQVSDELARLTGVRHESPQALLLRGGQVVWHASHGQIEADRLRRAGGT